MGELGHTSATNSRHALPSGEPYPSPPSCCHLVDAITVSSRDHSIFLLGPLLQDGREHGKTGVFHDREPTVTLPWLQSEFLHQKPYCGIL